jgi:hypothetical protein
MEKQMIPAEKKWNEMVRESKEATEDFQSFMDDSAIIWVNELIEDLKAELKELRK